MVFATEIGFGGWIDAALVTGALVVLYVLTRALDMGEGWREKRRAGKPRKVSKREEKYLADEELRRQIRGDV